MSTTSNEDHQSPRSCISLMRCQYAEQQHAKGVVVEVKEALARFRFPLASGGPSCRCKFKCYVITAALTLDPENHQHTTTSAMNSMRYLRAPKCISINACRTINFSPLSTGFRRMAHFYNVDVAGLTDEQAEVCKPLRKKTLIVLYDSV